jgi:hypothetical protein
LSRILALVQPEYRDHIHWPQRLAQALVEILELIRASAAGVALRNFVNRPETAPRAVIHPDFQVGEGVLEELRSEVLAVLQSGFDKDLEAVVTRLTQTLDRDGFWPGDFCNCLVRILEKALGIKRYPAPRGWVGHWPNIGTRRRFLDWLDQEISSREVAMGTRAPGLHEPEFAITYSNAITFALANKISTDGLALDAATVRGELAELIALRNRVEGRPQELGEEEQSVLERLRFEEATGTVFLDDKIVAENLDPRQYRLVVRLAEEEGDYVCREELEKTPGLRGANLDRILKSLRRSGVTFIVGKRNTGRRIALPSKTRR